MLPFGVKPLLPQPKHAIANCSQTVGLMLSPGEYKRAISLIAKVSLLWFCCCILALELTCAPVHPLGTFFQTVSNQHIVHVLSVYAFLDVISNISASV